MSLEVLAISVGLSTFVHELMHRSVIVYSDNSGAEAAVRQGTAKAFDHCLLIHEIWTLVCLCVWVQMCVFGCGLCVSGVVAQDQRLDRKGAVSGEHLRSTFARILFPPQGAGRSMEAPTGGADVHAGLI